MPPEKLREDPPELTRLVLNVGPSGAHFLRKTKVGFSVPLVPYQHVELDLSGPFEVGDPNGFRYLFGGVDRATGRVLPQPIRAKSAAKEALRAYLALIRAKFPGIELNLRLSFKDIKVPSLPVVSSDRGGELTTSYGATQSEYDALLNDAVRRLNTPSTPKSGASRIERVRGSLPKAARYSLFTSGLEPQFFFHAVVYAADTANSLPTEANALGLGEAPDQALGLNYDLGVLVPFGALGVKRGRSPCREPPWPGAWPTCWNMGGGAVAYAALSFAVSSMCARSPRSASAMST